MITKKRFYEIGRAYEFINEDIHSAWGETDKEMLKAEQSVREFFVCYGDAMNDHDMTLIDYIENKKIQNREDRGDLKNLRWSIKRVKRGQHKQQKFLKD